MAANRDDEAQTHEKKKERLSRPPALAKRRELHRSAIEKD